MANMFDLIANSDVISMEQIPTIEKITALLFNDKIRLLLGNDAKLKAMIAEAIITSNTHADQAIANLIDSAPDTLNTLKEIAAVISEHEELMNSLNNLINTKANDADVYNKSEVDYNITNGNVLSATKWTTARTLSLGGHATGSVSINGSQNVILNVDIKRGVANGVAELGSDGKVVAAQLPSYVDDVIEAATKSAFPATGESGKIYVDISTNLTYRWSGTIYTEISQSLALGETSATAFRGDYGKIAYDHTSRTDNPHNTTAAQVGLGNVPNVSTNNQTPTYTIAGTLAALNSGETLTLAMGKISKAVSDFIAHNSNTSNPHSTTAAQVGLGNVPNVSTNNQTPTYTEAGSLTALSSGETLTLAMGKLTKAVNTFIAHNSNTSNPHSVTKAQVGLGSVDNTADSTKNVLSATKWTTARTLSLTGDASGSVIMDGNSNVSLSVDIKRGVANGIAELGSDGKVLSSQLPSYVDDVIEAATKSAFPTTGESGKIYVDISTNLTYRWSGTIYTEISSSLALGETSATAFRGDYGKIAYDHTSRTDNPHNTTAAQVGLGNVPNVATNDQTPTYTVPSNLAALSSGETLTIAMGKLAQAVNSLISHKSNSSNPHNVTKAQVGLGNVDNVNTNSQTPTYTEAVSLTALSSGEAMSIAMGKLSKAVNSLIAHLSNTLNPHSVTKAQVGLSSVDNTADSAKNVLSATKWTTARTLTLTGDVSGSVSIDGSGNVSITTTVADNSHNHTSLTGNVGITGTISSTGATFDGGTNTTITVKCDDNGNATLNLMGDDQGTGILYVGQSAGYGGGIEYNGDNTPLTSGAGADYIALYRRNASVNTWTARNQVGSNDWEFVGAVNAPNGQVKGKTLASIDGVIQLGSVTQAIKFDAGAGTLADYYSAKDIMSFRGTSNSEDNVVVKAGYGHFNQNVYVDKKVGINKFAMVYNATEDSLDFIYG